MVSYPTRLLDLSPNSESRLKLIITSQERPTEPWATLSHCWGSIKDRFQLTTANIDSLRQSIALSALPVLSRDAVDVARNLGIRYLWIDVLCILQDSLSDWQIESGLMALAYSLSTLTIAATRSSSSNESLFIERNCNAISLPIIRPEWLDGNNPHVLLPEEILENINLLH